MSSRRVGALVGLTHCVFTLVSATAFPNWYSYVGVPAVPLAVWLLEVWNPHWANFASSGTRWAFVLPVWGLNFLTYAGIGWGFAKWLRGRQGSTRQNSVEGGPDPAAHQ